MLAEALASLKKLADDANPARKIVTPPGEPKHAYLVEQPDGTFSKWLATPKPARHAAASLQTLTEWAKAVGDCTIWYSRAGVVASESPGSESADWCTLMLAPSPQLAALAEWERSKGITFDQAGLIRLLRTTLADCWSGDLLKNVRKLNIQKAKQVEAEQDRGKVSVSRKDVAEMSGSADIPEEVVFDVPIFAAGSMRARASVRVAVELNPETERFVLAVIPGQTEAAFTKGEGWLLQEISEYLGTDAAEMPVYLGQPG